MIEARALEYRKAYVELSEIIKKFPKEIISKIPTNIINNIEISKDNTYSWSYDDSKILDEQNIMVETKALFISLYRKYLMDQQEKEKWEEYDRISSSIVEKEKMNQYDPSKIFDKDAKENKFSAFNVSNTSTAVSVTVVEEVKEIDTTKQYLILMEEETWFEKISKMFKGFISKFFGKNK